MYRFKGNIILAGLLVLLSLASCSVRRQMKALRSGQLDSVAFNMPKRSASPNTISVQKMAQDTIIIKDADGNVLVGNKVLKYNSHNNMAVLPKEKLLVMQGVDDMLVVDTADVLLVCKKGNERDIRKFLNDAKMKLGENIG